MLLGRHGRLAGVADLDRRMTFVYMMNKMASGGGTIGAALTQRACHEKRLLSPKKRDKSKEGAVKTVGWLTIAASRGIFANEMYVVDRHRSSFVSL